MDKHRTAAAIAAAALLLGLAWDVLLRWIPWGINVLLWTALYVGAAWFVRRRAESAPLHKFAAIAALVAAAGIAWRDSQVLVMLDVILLALFLPLLALNARNVQVAASGLVGIVGALVTTGAQAVVGLPQLVFRDLAWSRFPTTGFRGAGVAARGTFIAAPALIVFGSLLTSADPAFARVIRNIFVFDFGELIVHAMVTVAIAAICAGFLHSLALGDPMPHFGRPAFLRLPAAETNVALLLINLMFAAFVAVQFRYFFSSTTLGTVEHARRGFFELVWVVGLVLPMLLVVDWLVEKKTLFRILATIQVSLIFVIAASAYRRMQLYRDEYGLTRLRLFTTAFMIWIAVLLLWFALTVLTGRRHRFAVGVLSTAVAAVVILHAINPDAMIVETNLSRAHRRPVDTHYLTLLSADAAPALVAHGLPQLAKEVRPMGWRTWNYSRAEALRRTERPERR
jgi:Domain of unknown function (DUF4173)